jgi:hypothetical protein
MSQFKFEIITPQLFNRIKRAEFTSFKILLENEENEKGQQENKEGTLFEVIYKNPEYGKSRMIEYFEKNSVAVIPAPILLKNIKPEMLVDALSELEIYLIPTDELKQQEQEPIKLNLFGLFEIISEMQLAASSIIYNKGDADPLD